MKGSTSEGSGFYFCQTALSPNLRRKQTLLSLLDDCLVQYKGQYKVQIPFRKDAQMTTILTTICHKTKLIYNKNCKMTQTSVSYEYQNKTYFGKDL